MPAPVINPLPPLKTEDGDQAIDFLNESVTKGDVVSRVTKNGVVHVMIPFAGDWWGAWGIDQIALPPNPPPYWSYQRDQTMRATVFKESFWAGAVGIAISKIAAMGFDITGDVPLRIKKGREVVLYADGRQVGYVSFLSKHLRDFICTDNGVFFEIVRETAAWSSRVKGIRHLDSARCIRTGDPLIPIVYRDRRNVYHELKYYEVVAIADMPDAGETYNGVGFCAASRAYYDIYKMASIEWYIREKVSGLQPLAIHIVNGILDSQLKDSITAAKEGAISRGVIAHMGAVVIGIPADQQPNLVTIPLAELPDQFNRQQETDHSVLAYANAIGLDPQDLQPLSGRPLGSGMQTEILHEKAQGRGLAAWKQQFIHHLNEFVLAKGTVFSFYDKDFRDLKQKADLSKALAEASNLRITGEITTPDQELQILVDLNELPREFLPEDKTAGDSLSDVEKPVEENENGEPVEPAEPAAVPAETEKPTPGETTKEIDFDFLMDELDAATSMFQRIEAGEITLKHLQGKHNQKRHSWRYGPNVPLSRLKRQRSGDDEEEWGEFKARARARRGGGAGGGGGKGGAGGGTKPKPAPDKDAPPRKRAEIVAEKLRAIGELSNVAEKKKAMETARDKYHDKIQAKSEIRAKAREALNAGDMEKYKKLNDEADEYEKKVVDPLREAYNKSIKEHNASTSEVHDQYAKALQVDDPTSIYAIYDRVGKDRKAEFQTTVGMVAGIVSSKVMPPNQSVSISGRSGSRANYDPIGAIVNIKNGGNRVLAHELGHHVERRSPGLLAKVMEFYQSRTAGEPTRSLANIFQGHGYRRSEVTKTDKWIHAYMGKIYPTATELLSMGIEYLLAEPMTLLNQDPEYFNFLINVLQGE